MSDETLNFFTAEVLTSNYLIPYEEGGNGCKSKTNCLFCTSDAKCAWCSDTHTCHDKSKNDSLCLHSNPKLRPNQCSSCTNFIHCSDCVSAESDGSCEWLANDARVSIIWDLILYDSFVAKIYAKTEKIKKKKKQ